jgi:uncharacterized protein
MSLQAQGTRPIHAIQGTGSRSPFEGAVVSTDGIVTARKSNGFFIQSPDSAVDADPRTSEGLFVFTGSAPAANVTPGTTVTVTGRVIEFVPAADPASPPLTEIGESPTIQVRGAGAALPAPVELQGADLRPEGGHEQLERFEGMRVRVSSLTVVGPTLGNVNEANATASTNGVFYGVLTGTPRPFREPGLDARDGLPPGSPCCVPRFDGNPERLRVDSDAQPGVPPMDVQVGQVSSSLVGVLDYGFRAYTLLPDAQPVSFSFPAARAPLRAAADHEFSVAFINLGRFFDTTDDRDVGDVVLTPNAFASRVAKASLYIRRSLALPDVVAVAEVENLATLRTLAAVLNRDARNDGLEDLMYEAFLEEGNDPGGIDVGALVKRRVEVLELRQEGKHETFRATPSTSPEVLNDRPPLLLTVRSTNAQNAQIRLTLLVNHLRSLNDVDSPTSGARVRAKRAAQAEFLAGLVQRRLADDPLERILVLGDLNAFEFSDGYVDVVGTIAGRPAAREEVVVGTRDLVDPDLVNLLVTLPREHRYSYVFDGNAQVLDHMLASERLFEQLSLFTYVRGNADSPEVFRADSRRPERVSDHDAPVAYFRLGR